MSVPAIQDSAGLRAITDYLRDSYAGELIRLAPNGTAPIFALTSLMNKTKTASAIEHGYWTKTMVFPSMVLGGAVANGTDATFTVASTANVIPGDVFIVWAATRELVRVTTVNSGTSVTVVRSCGAIAGVAIANGVTLYKISTAFEEASARPAPRNINPVRVMNYTQIFRNTWAVPGTVAALKPTVGNTPHAENREDAVVFHATDIETAILFEQKYLGTLNGQTLHKMEGIVESIRRLVPANVFTAGATTNYTQLQTMCNVVFNVAANGRNGNVRTAVVGGTARQVINDIGRNTGVYQIMEGQTSFGMQYTSFKTSRGTFNMIEHPILNSNPDWAKMMLILDMSTIALAYLPGRQQHETGSDERGNFATGEDSIGGDFLSELTLELIIPSANAVIYNLTAYGA